MKVFVINLERSVQRRKSIEDQLNKQGIDFEIIKAVDGSTLSDEYLNSVCNYEELAKSPHLQYKGMYGCILSHYSIYKRMAEDNIPVALVLEDDVIIQPKLKEAISRIEKIIKQNEAILLFSQNNYMPTVFSKKESEHVIDSHTAYYPMDPWMFGSTAGYVITLDAARAMADYVLPIRVGPDAWGFFYTDNVITSLRCVAPFLLQPAGFKSDINYVSEKGVIGSIIKAINTYNIFPIKQLLDFRRKRLLARSMAYSFSNNPSPVNKDHSIGRTNQ